MSHISTQVLVIGGGPAGSTTAALLARAGIRVTLLERTRMPRYHIGESLLPSCLKIFDLLGVREKVEAHGFIQKEGGYFDWGGDIWPLEFGTPARPLYGFQVIRSEFDKLLLDHARSQGADVREETEVKDIVFEGQRPVGATCVAADGTPLTVSYDIVVDASGRAGVLSTRYLNNRNFHEAFRNVAVWGYWHNAKRLDTGPRGAIATCSTAAGWVWAIPLHDGTLSVGTVMHTSRFKELRRHFTLEEIYRDAVSSSRVVGGLVAGGDLPAALRTETDYSYAAARFAGPGWYLVGDAACFLDPLLSTGVHLATFAGLVAAASCASCLRGEVTPQEASRFFGESYRRAYVRMLVVVSAFYQTHRGRDSYFREAQRLTCRDYSENEFMRAFVHIVSGVEDLQDLGDVRSADLLASLVRMYDEHYEFLRQRDAWPAMELSDLTRSMGRMRVIGAVQEEFSLTPETAIDGFYVGTEPLLGLKRAPIGAASAAQGTTSASPARVL